MAQTVSTDQRLHGLDTLRGAAILMVMGYHFNYLLPPVFHVFSSFGWMGVDLFFVLSGYLIGRQLMRPYAHGHRPSTLEFYRNRAYRILPAYAVVVALYFLLPAWRERPGISPLWQFLTFTENLFVDYGRNQAFSHVWSLCVEEHFYLLLPVVLVVLMRRPSARKAAAAAAAVVVAGVVCRAAAWHTLLPVDPQDDRFSQYYIERVYYPTWCRLDGLLDGVLLAAIQLFRPAWWRRLMHHGHATMAASVALFAASVAMFLGRFDSAHGAAMWSSFAGFPLLSASLALLLLSSVSHTGLLRWRIPGARWLATLAYSLYLTHKATVHLLRQFVMGEAADQTWHAAAVYFAGCLAVAALLYLLVERPFLKLRDRASRTIASQSQAAPEALPVKP